MQEYGHPPVDILGQVVSFDFFLSRSLTDGSVYKKVEAIAHQWVNIEHYKSWLQSISIN